MHLLDPKEVERKKGLKIILRKAFDKIISENNRNDAGRVFNVLKTIIGNISKFPNDPKYRKLKSRNKIMISIITIQEFRDFLILCGGLIKVVDFEEHWVLQDTPKYNEIVFLAVPILDEYAAKLHQMIERETRQSDKKKQEEETRVKVAMQFREDRAIVEERFERERHNRIIREYRAKEIVEMENESHQVNMAESKSRRPCARSTLLND